MGGMGGTDKSMKNAGTSQGKATREKKPSS